MSRIEGTAIARVTYSFELNEKDSEKVIRYAEEHDLSYASATEILYLRGEVSIYRNSEEIDFETEYVEEAYDENDSNGYCH